MSKITVFGSALIVLAGCSLLMADNWLRKHETRCKAEVEAKSQEKAYPQPVLGPNRQVCFEVAKETFLCVAPKEGTSL